MNKNKLECNLKNNVTRIKKSYLLEIKIKAIKRQTKYITQITRILEKK